MGRRQQRFALGLELSTQSAKSVVLDLARARVAYSGKIDYDAAFPLYQTRGGVLAANQPGVRHTSPLLLIEVLDAVFQDLVRAGVGLGAVAAIKADAMQHCTVYADRALAGRLRQLPRASDLLAGLSPCISRPTSPI